jgi:hypothetical protein
MDPGSSGRSDPKKLHNQVQQQYMLKNFIANHHITYGPSQVATNIYPIYKELNPKNELLMLVFFNNSWVSFPGHDHNFDGLMVDNRYL